MPTDVPHGDSLWQRFCRVTGLATGFATVILAAVAVVALLVWVAISFDYSSLWNTWTKAGLVLVGVAVLLSLVLPHRD